jgi:hypothetical protein
MSDIGVEQSNKILQKAEEKYGGSNSDYYEYKYGGKEKRTGYFL